jgi:acyl carrier protein
VQGVVHAAGVAGGGVIPLKDSQAAARVMAPKVQGTLALEAALREEPLDFVFLCSSVAALLGGFGQVDYCGANAFLDAYARWAQGPWPGRVVSANWDAWREVGMAVNTPVSGVLQLVRDVQLKVGIAPEEGVLAFNRILGAGLPQVAVFTMDLRPALAKQVLSRRGGGLATALAVPAEATAPATAVEPAAVETAAGELERLVARSWEKTLGRSNIAGNDNFFELGGDSLTALQVIALLKLQLGREIPIVTFYEAPTVTLLAKALSAEPEAKGAPALEEVGQRAETRLDLMQRRRRQRTQLSLDEQA